MRVVALALLALTAACYSPRYQDCALTCESGRCPDGLSCEEGWCRLAPSAGSCEDVLADAGAPDADDEPDASPTVADADPGAPDAEPCTCDPLAQTCCAVDDACDLLPPTQAPACRAVDAPGGQAAPCSVATQCAAAHSCVEDPAPGALGSCHLFCDDDGDCGGGGARCDLAIGAGASAATLCSTNCDPVASTGCPSGWGCGLRFGTRWQTDCHVVGTGKAGNPCDADDDCKPGLFCSAAQQCVAYCVLGASDTCQGQPKCTALPDAPTVGGVEYGACL